MISGIPSTPIVAAGGGEPLAIAGNSGAGGSWSCIGGPSSAPGPATGPGDWASGSTGCTAGGAGARCTGARAAGAGRAGDCCALGGMKKPGFDCAKTGDSGTIRLEANAAGRSTRKMGKREMSKLEPRSETKPEKLRLVEFVFHYGLRDVDVDQAEGRLPRHADARADAGARVVDDNGAGNLGHL
jgi:hypothetical protein